MGEAGDRNEELVRPVSQSEDADESLTDDERFALVEAHFTEVVAKEKAAGRDFGVTGAEAARWLLGGLFGAVADEVEDVVREGRMFPEIKSQAELCAYIRENEEYLLRRKREREKRKLSEVAPSVAGERSPA